MKRDVSPQRPVLNYIDQGRHSSTKPSSHLSQMAQWLEPLPLRYQPSGEVTVRLLFHPRARGLHVAAHHQACLEPLSIDLFTIAPCSRSSRCGVAIPARQASHQLCSRQVPPWCFLCPDDTVPCAAIGYKTVSGGNDCKFRRDRQGNAASLSPLNASISRY
jgi:hypothetical protein